MREFKLEVVKFYCAPIMNVSRFVTNLSYEWSPDFFEDMMATPNYALVQEDLFFRYRAEFADACHLASHGVA